MSDALTAIQDWLGSVAGICSTGGVIVAALGTVYVKAVHPVVRMAKDFPEVKADVGRMSKELTTNGGSSLKDAVKRTETKVNTIEANQRSRIEADHDVAFYTDAKGEFTAVTAGYTRLTGIDTPSARRGGWKLAMHSDDVEHYSTLWNDAISHGTIFVAECRFKHVHKGGSKPCRVTATPVMSGEMVCGWAGSVEDLDPQDNEIDPDASEAIAAHLHRKGLE